MNTCGTCKHFGKRYEQDQEKYDDPGREVSIFHVCEFVKHNAEFDRAFPAVAFVADGSGYHAVFCVKEDFGCNQWEARRAV